MTMLMMIVVLVEVAVLVRVIRLELRQTEVTCPHQAGAPARLGPAESDGRRWCRAD